MHVLLKYLSFQEFLREQCMFADNCIQILSINDAQQLQLDLDLAISGLKPGSVMKFNISINVTSIHAY